jgi:SAM-dependent methyltransferase
MNWRIKGLTQKGLSAIPGGKWINDRLQRTVGGLRNFAGVVDSKFNDWTILMTHMRDLGMRPTGRRFLEIGTGWFPTLPICFSLAGSGRCDTYDLVRHLNQDLTLQMFALLEPRLADIAKASMCPVDEIESKYERWKRASTLPELLRLTGIEYHAPADAGASGLPEESIDVVFSNSVLEHVPRDTIAKLMSEANRVLRPGGLVIHSLNCGDHYAYFDRNITFMNYLAYSERQWSFWNNPLLYQNRLRPQDFIDLALQAGLRLVLRKQRPRPELLTALSSMAIAPEFRKYPPEELCCTSLDFVAQKPV